MNKVTALAQYQAPVQIGYGRLTDSQIEILKNTICKGVSNDEFQVFLMTCEKTGLDPFMKQIYPIKRKSKKPDGTWGETMTIQTGIDGYRLIAERTECYAPGPEPTYTFDEDRKLQSATAYVKKLTKDGTWHTVAATAYLDEYCQMFNDRSSGERKPLGLWATMPKTMLAKCAEAVGLRRAFPGEMSNVYTKEEMMQAEVTDVTPKISLEQASELGRILDNCDPLYTERVYAHLMKQYRTTNLCDLPAEIYDRIKEAATKNMEAQAEIIKQEAQKLVEVQ